MGEIAHRRPAAREPGAALRLLMVLLGVVGFVLLPGAGTAASSALGDGPTVSRSAGSATGITRLGGDFVAVAAVTATRHGASSGGGFFHGLVPAPVNVLPRWPHRGPARLAGSSLAPAGVAPGVPQGRAPPSC